MLEGLWVEEIFQFDKRWYGVLKSRDGTVCRLIRITAFRAHGYNWHTLNPTLEKAIWHFYHDDRAKP